MIKPHHDKGDSAIATAHQGPLKSCLSRCWEKIKSFWLYKGEMDGAAKKVVDNVVAGDNSSDQESTISQDENKDRGNWSGKLDFLLSCLSYAVGLGNLWRFPYLCYSNGGGAFLIPYVIMLTFTGVPLFFMELSFGQYASSGVVSIWKICPLFQGIGWGMFMVSFFVGIYYNVIIAWTLYYIFASFTAQVPWATCDNEWNTPACSLLGIAEARNCTNYNGTYFNHTCFTIDEYGEDMFYHVQNLSNLTEVPQPKSPSDEYFHNYVLDISEGIHQMGGLRWQLALCLLLAWVLVGLCLIRGIKSSGKAVYFTATFPYLVLIVLLVRGATLPGCLDGILFYLTPEWHRLLTAKVWGDAAVQIFFSLSPCWGGLITLASYNKFHNNALRDSLFVAVGNCLTSIFAGFVIFGIIGYMAHELGVGVGEVAQQGAGLAFIVYPQVVTRLPISPLWSILFFSMLLTLGLGTQFAVVNTVHTTLLDRFPKILRKGKRPAFTLVGICLVCYLIGLGCCSEGGMYLLQLWDNYAATYSVLIIGFTECVAISWVYGVERFMDDIHCMLKTHRPSIWWKIMWKFVTPLILVFIIIFTWIDFKPSKYGTHVFPAWADAIGWVITLASLLPIPAIAIYKVVRYEIQGRNYWERVKSLCSPTGDWGPALPEHQLERVKYESQGQSQESDSSYFESQLPLSKNYDGSNGSNGVNSSNNIASNGLLNNTPTVQEGRKQGETSI
ncbi:sodium- and chloride-dependent glycine transporter 1-like isoform X4 [Lineus longissimus]|uniref:sodium- and chloride-dependent glycine transporter 1-like isoform X4 n=1 Tax=Lineus longissimus TaxID=88925 RepID=UPI00315CE7B1